MVKDGVRAADVKDALQRDLAEAALALKSREISDGRIHDVRKKLKSARAKLRLLRDAIGRTAYARENAALRDAARPLSAVRDGRVMLDTVDALLERKGKRARRVVLTALRGRFRRTHAAARAQFEAEHRGAASAAALERASRRTSKWTLRGGRAALVRALRRVYGKARKALMIAERDPSPENLHELRKQVKYLLEALTPLEGAAIASAKVLKRADALASLLGEDHDLHVLDAAVDAAKPAAGGRVTDVKDDLEQRRVKLRKRALRRAWKLFRRAPRSFAKRLSL